MTFTYSMGAAGMCAYDDFMVLDPEDFDEGTSASTSTMLASSILNFRSRPSVDGYARQESFPDWMCSKQDPFVRGSSKMVSRTDEEDDVRSFSRPAWAMHDVQEEVDFYGSMVCGPRLSGEGDGVWAENQECSSYSSRVPSVISSDYGSEDQGSRTSFSSLRTSTSLSSLSTVVDDNAERIQSLRRCSSGMLGPDKPQSNALTPIIEDPYQGKVPVDAKRVRWAVYSPSSTPTLPSLEVMPWDNNRKPEQRRTTSLSQNDVSAVMKARRKFKSASFVFASEMSSLTKVLMDEQPDPEETLHSTHPYANVYPLYVKESHPPPTFHAAMARTKARPKSLSSFSSLSTLDPVYEIPPGELRRTSSRTSFSSNASSDVVTSSSICLKAPDVLDSASINSTDTNRWSVMKSRIPFGESKLSLQKFGKLVRLGRN